MTLCLDPGTELGDPLSKAFFGLKRLAIKQAGLTRSALGKQHNRLLGPQGMFAVFSEQILAQGRQAPMLQELSRLDDAQHLDRAEQAVDFVLGHHHRREAASNPFLGQHRASLCCLVFGDSTPVTVVERFAAYEAIRQHDSEFFIKLIATTRGVVERRLVFQGLIEHFDRLLPIEQSIYPPHYRDVQQTHLTREEAIYGVLPLGRPVTDYLEEMSPAELLGLVRHLDQSGDH